MEYKIAKKVKVNGEFYIILAVIKQDGIEYAFANKLESLEGNPTEEYIILSKEREKLDIETNQETINKLFPLIQQQLQEQIKKIAAD